LERARALELGHQLLKVSRRRRSRRRRDLDHQVNNAAFTGELVPNVTASRGKLIFGIPQAFQNCSRELGGFIFAYQLDELENPSLISVKGPPARAYVAVPLG
jgi:hypothetical protein